MKKQVPIAAGEKGAAQGGASEPEGMSAGVGG